jgi:predicted Zn-dependent peptidase
MVAHCGIIINAGSRDELPEEHGMAHFIEHVIFKGTQRRKAYQIVNRLENVGGEINAYTTKELTCIFAAFLRENYCRALELIGDILFNSIFPEKELEKEKNVILDEINSYKDTPSDLIFDDFEEYLYHDDPIGRNILGNKKNLKAFTQNDIIRFIERNYQPSQMVLTSVGNISFKRLIQMAEKFFGGIYVNNPAHKRSPFTDYQTFYKRITKKTYQKHCIIGGMGYSMHHKNKTALSLLNNIIGGPGFNSRLNVALREKKGFTYHIESNYTAYTDTGYFGIYFGTDKEHLDQSMDLIDKELKTIRQKKLGTLQLSKAKKQLTGQMAIAADNKEHLMLAVGKEYLLINRVFDPVKAKQRIDAVTADDILTVANEVLTKDNLSVLIYD